MRLARVAFSLVNGSYSWMGDHLGYSPVLILKELGTSHVSRVVVVGLSHVLRV